jgi:ABC-type antimicrobial peptide transport system permease subunit
MYETIYIIGFIVFWIIATYIIQVLDGDDPESRFLSFIIALIWPAAIPMMISIAILYAILYVFVQLIDRLIDKFIAYRKSQKKGGRSRPIKEI